MNRQEEQSTIWNPIYNLGIEEIDRDHQRLFSIIGKVRELTHGKDEGKARHACREGVKFFKNYTIQHFEREEEFMRSISYGGYERHRKIHEDMRQKVLPALEEELEEKAYSMESVRHFLGVCLAWVSTHIKVEDRAIVDGRLGRQLWLDIADDGARFEYILRELMKNTYELEIQIVSNHYTGWDYGKAVYHEITFIDASKKVTQCLLLPDEKLVLALVGLGLGINADRVDEFLLSAVKEVMETIGKQISFQMGKEEEYRASRTGVMLSTSEMEEVFQYKKVVYSTLFSTSLGHFACCVYER